MEEGLGEANDNLTYHPKKMSRQPYILRIEAAISSLPLYSRSLGVNADTMVDILQVANEHEVETPQSRLGN